LRDAKSLPTVISSMRARYQGTTTTQSGNASRPLGIVDGSDSFGRRNNQR